MSEIAPLTTSTESTAQQAAELDAMRRMLEASRGTFSLSIAVCNSPALQDYLIGRLQESAPDIAIISIPESSSDPFGYVKSQLDGRKPQAVFITDIERIVPSDAKDYLALRSLNASRELWEQRFPCPVIFWIPEYAAALLSINARDFWRYRSHRFEFVSEFATANAGVNDHWSGDLIAASNLTQDEKQFRIAELEQRLANVGEPPDPILLNGKLLWLNELATLHLILGRLDEAERYWEELQEFARQSSCESDIAKAYGNLGNVWEIRGDLDGAEAMYRKALAIDEKLNRLEGMAIQYGNLGNVLSTRGDLNSAEVMYRRAIAIDGNLKNVERVAGQYCNLGNVLQMRGFLADAEELYRAALEIFTKNGRPDGMGTAYGNLGIVLVARGDLNGAEAMYREALNIYEKLGHLEGMATVYGNLGINMKTRGDLDGAEVMHRKALATDEKLEHLEGMARHYNNLGNVMKIRGDIEGTLEMWTKARDLYAKLGAQHRVEQLQGAIDDLAK